MNIINMLKQALEIKNQKKAKGNTEKMVGGLFESIVDSLDELQNKMSNMAVSWVWKEPVDTINNLPTLSENATLGWAIFVKSVENYPNGTIHVHNGTEWINTGFENFPNDVIRKSELSQVLGNSKDVAPSEKAVREELDSTRFFYILGSNLHNPTTDTIGKSLSEDGLIITDSPTYILSNYIDIQHNEVYRCNKPLRKYWIFDGKSSPAIQFKQESTEANVDITPQGKYIRFLYSISVNSTDVKFGKVAEDINVPYTETPYTRGNKEILTEDSSLFVSIEAHIESVDSKMESIDNKIVYKPSANLHNYATVSINQILDTAGGQTHASTSYDTSDFIEVKSNEKYTSSVALRRYCMYDTNKNETQTVGGYDPLSVTELTTVATAKYIRLSWSKVTGVALTDVKFGLSDEDIYEEYGEILYDKNGNQIATINNEKVEENEQVNTITLKNSDKIVMINSSSMESHYCIENKSFISKINDFLDWVYIGYGLSGGSPSVLTTRILANTPAPAASGVNPSDIGASYVHVGQFGNSSEEGLRDTDSDKFIEINRKLALAAQSVFGAKLIVGTGYTSYNEYQLEMAMKELADELGADCIPFGFLHDRIIRHLGGIRSYSEFWGANHPGTRTNSFYAQSMLNYMEEWQTPKQSIKLFKARSGVVDFNYRNNLERARKFYSIQTGEQSLSDEKSIYYDRLTTTTLYTPFVYRQSEYLSILANKPTNLGTTVLVEVILPVINSKKIELQIKANEGASIQLYDNVTSSFTSVATPYKDGVYTIDASKFNYTSFDKIKCFITSGSDIIISDVSCTYLEGTKKKRIDKKELINYSGRAIVSGIDDFARLDEWDNPSNNPMYRQTDKYTYGLTDHPNYLNFNSQIMLMQYSNNTAKKIGKTISLVDLYADKVKSDSLRLRVEVFARMFPKIYNPNEYEAWIVSYPTKENPFTDRPQITKDSFDYGTLVLSIGDTKKALFRKLVPLFWSKIAFNIDLPPFIPTDLTIEIHREINDINSTWDMELADVIVNIV